MKDEIFEYFLGDRLYGDNFSIEEINNWFLDESEGYANLGSKDRSSYVYGYHELNKFHGFRFLKGRNFDNVLGIGSAYGDEFIPIANNLSKITIIDPSDAFCDTTEILSIPCVYRKPNASGDMSFEDGFFDLISCLGVMHHIPNVSHVLRECGRCLRKGGVMLLREPITSMGDWRKPRLGLTKRERGIPLHLMDEMISLAGLRVVHKSLCHFPVVPKVAKKFGVAAYNSQLLTAIDSLLSILFSWNLKYHRTRSFEKFGPAAVYYVLTR